MELFEIFLTFFKISISTFGGGMAMFPILQSDVVFKKKWLSDEELSDYYALSQGIPGIIAINVSSLIGYKKRGFFGVIAASLGIISPSLIIILVLTKIIDNFSQLTYFSYVLNGISLAVTALIFKAVTDLWKKSIKDNICLMIFIISFFVIIFIKFSPIIFVLISSFFSVIITNNKNKKGS